jgi:hypothetical protein
MTVARHMPGAGVRKPPPEAIAGVMTRVGAARVVATAPAAFMGLAGIGVRYHFQNAHVRHDEWNESAKVANPGLGGNPCCCSTIPCYSKYHPC